MLIKNHVSNLKTSATLFIHEKSAQLASQGKIIYRLGFGQFPFPVPASVIESLIQHSMEKDSLPVSGLVPLREAISKWINKRASKTKDSAAKLSWKS